MEGDNPQTSTAVIFQSVLFKMHKGSWKVVSLIISKLPTHWVNQHCENKNCRISQHWLVDKVVKGSLLMSNFSSTGQQWVLNYYPQRSQNGSSLFFLRHQPDGYQESQNENGILSVCRKRGWKAFLWHHMNSKWTCFFNIPVQLQSVHSSSQTEIAELLKKKKAKAQNCPVLKTTVQTRILQPKKWGL